MPVAEVRDLLPTMHDALDWMIAAANADGFLDYVDETGHGLSNQGWKDSGDSIQWRDGSLAAGPIALSEVQGYAYEAAVKAADLLDALEEDGAERLRAWAAELRCTSWAQLMLKYVLADSAITCAIPGTRNPRHVADNLAAALAPLPDAAMRRRIREAAMS